MKKSQIIIISSIIILTFIGVFLFNYNQKEKIITDSDHLYDEAIEYLALEYYNKDRKALENMYNHFVSSYDKFGITKHGDNKYVYMWVLGEGYYLEDEEIKDDSGYSMFFKFTFLDNEVIKYEIPKDGNEYADSIKELTLNYKMYKKVINYDSKLNNDKEVEDYYSKVTNPQNLTEEDIVYKDGLLFSISSKKLECVSITLSVYDNGKYFLYNSHKACRDGEFCTLMLEYGKPIEGTYDYDVIKIIQNSIIADNMQFNDDNMPEYEIYTGGGNILYMLITDNKNTYLNEFLDELDLDLHTCSTPVYN